MSADIRQAFDKASGPKTPWNPSRKAIAKVKNAIPAPTACPYCSGVVELVNNERIYRRSYGEWPWAYLCTTNGCGAYVGLHPFTAIPLGTLANAELRRWRKAAKDAFNPLWDGPTKSMSRTEAYTWLAAQLGIAAVNTCHVGWFDIDACKRTIMACGGAHTPDSAAAEIASLVATVGKMDEEFDLVLSNKQQDWLDDILHAAAHGKLNATEGTMNFLRACAGGSYSAGGPA